jgi:hypothetical protein
MMVTSFLLPLLLISLLFSYANVGGGGCVSASRSSNSPSAGSTAADGYLYEGENNIIIPDGYHPVLDNNDNDDILRRHDDIISSSSKESSRLPPMPPELLPRPSLESVLRVTVIAPSQGKSPTCAYSLVQLENVVSQLYNITFIILRGLQSPPLIYLIALYLGLSIIICLMW